MNKNDIRHSIYSKVKTGNNIMVFYLLVTRLYSLDIDKYRHLLTIAC